MISRHYTRRRLPEMFARTSADAFRGMDYAAAIERPAPSLWARFINFIRSL